ncbi:MAG: hypothetical protein QHH17_07190, partial [Candidatus Bathyarchaeota archaeon]|nr:hypothetical protein [Candidatus Bathyarchaeota archaeon]
DGSITGQGLIRVFIWNQTLREYKYIIKPTNITPRGYTIEKGEELVTYEWRLNGSVQNVILHLETEKIPKPQNNWIVYATIISIGVVVGVIIVYVKMKRTSKEMRSTKL